MTNTNSPARNVLLLLSGVSMVGALYLVFLYAPTDRNLGISQRIFYFHVSMAWVGFLAFFWVLVGSVGYLWKRSQKMDRLAYSSAEIGVVFTTLMLITGVLWAKPAWGVWWTWDPKLTTSLILWLLYVAYLMLRAYSPTGRPGRPLRRRPWDNRLRRRAHHLPLRSLVAHGPPARRSGAGG